eukprot:scaffold11693_cov116-Skeletonema_dohrnii-CCMP3373.AAC.4
MRSWGMRLFDARQNSFLIGFSLLPASLVRTHRKSPPDTQTLSRHNFQSDIAQSHTGRIIIAP